MFGKSRRSVLAMSTLVVAALSGSTLIAPSAQAATATYLFSMTLPGGPGHPAPVTAGIAILNGKLGLCIDFGKKTMDGTTFIPINGKVPGYSAATSAKLLTESALAVRDTEHVWASTGNKAAASRTATWYAVAEWADTGNKNAATYLHWLQTHNPSVYQHAQAIRGVAKHNTGTYRVHVAYTKTTSAVNKPLAGTVTVLYHDGTPAAGDTVTLSGLKARIVSVNGHAGNSAATNAKGQLTFVGKLTDMGDPRVTATVQVPSWRKGFESNASSTHQHMLSGVMEKTAGSATYHAAPNGGTMVTSCSTNCNGVATMTYTTAKLPSGAAPLRYTIKNGTKVAKTGYVTAGTQKTWSFKAADASTLVVYACKVAKVGGSCTGTTVKVSSPFVVFCPPAPALSVSFNCPCSGSVTMARAISLPASVRAYTETTKVGSSALDSAALKNSFNNTLKPASVPQGATVTVTVVATGGGHTRTWVYTYTVPSVSVTTT